MIQMNDLLMQYNILKSEIDSNIKKVLEHGKFIMGPEVYELEKELAQYVEVKYALTCSSGTTALMLPLLAWGIGKGDAVFTTPFTFISTSEVISLLGATPIFVDIDSKTFNISPDLLEKAINKVINNKKLVPKAIIPVDLFGLSADYEKVEKIGLKYNIKILEDAAQSFGATYKGKKAGSFGNVAATSFFPSKPLGCFGDGGAIFTNNKHLYEKLKSLRIHGQGKNKYDNERVGINGRLDTIQAGILLAKLSIFDKELSLKNEIARKYSDKLQGILTTPYIPKECTSVWGQYSVLSKNSDERDRLREALQNKNIKTNIYYERPLHLQKVYKKHGYKIGDFPITEEISKRIFSLPMYPYLSDEKIDIIVNTIKKSI
jgi:dTDP-4-amino-4,6-dideoxygalactose transaminase